MLVATVPCGPWSRRTAPSKASSSLKIGLPGFEVVKVVVGALLAAETFRHDEREVYVGVRFHCALISVAVENDSLDLRGPLRPGDDGVTLFVGELPLASCPAAAWSSTLSHESCRRRLDTRTWRGP